MAYVTTPPMPNTAIVVVSTVVTRCCPWLEVNNKICAAQWSAHLIELWAFELSIKLFENLDKSHPQA